MPPLPTAKWRRRAVQLSRHLPALPRWDLQVALSSRDPARSLLRWLSPVNSPPPLQVQHAPSPPPTLHQAASCPRLRWRGPVTLEDITKSHRRSRTFKPQLTAPWSPETPRGGIRGRSPRICTHPGLAFIPPAAAWPFEGWRGRVTGQSDSRRNVPGRFSAGSERPLAATASHRAASP